MQTMELVHIDDVYPYEDHDVRMNPRDVDSRECREYIAQLAEQFRYNKLNPGQPRVRPILYKDGGIYQIIDGECRYEAMKLLGTKYFYADVFDDLDDAETARQEAAKAMVETDAKRALTAEEMSRGVQQMLALDIPDEEVAAVARIDAGRVSRARRGARVASDAAYDMTLDRLAAIAEFEGDDEAVEALRDCPQGSWRGVYNGLVERRALEEHTAECRRVCEEHGMSELDEDVEDDEGTVYVERVWIDDKAAEKVARAVEGEPCTRYMVDGHWFEVRRDETPADRASETKRRKREEEEGRRFAEAREAWELEERAREQWVASHLGDPGSMKATAALLADRAMEGAAAFIERTGAEVDFSPTPALIAVGWGISWAPDKATAARAAMGRLQVYDVYGDRAGRYVELAGAMEKDGYVPNETGAAVTEALRKWEEKHNG